MVAAHLPGKKTERLGVRTELIIINKNTTRLQITLQVRTCWLEEINYCFLALDMHNL